MRLDKFLKVSRLIKRRTVANTFCDAGCVSIEGRPLKASAEVHPGDVLTMRFANRTLVIQVEQVPQKAVSPQQASTLYTVVSETWKKRAGEATSDDPDEGAEEE
jgi:ribosomal 50S subunit-recycling heat shock protein